MTPDESAVVERAGREPVGSLATVRPDGRPHLVPVTFALAGSEMYTMVDSKPKSSTSLQRLENIRSNAAVTLLIHHYEDDWSRLWWVRVDGRGRVVRRPDQLDRARALLTSKYRQYATTTLDGPAIVIDISSVTWWESSPGLLAQ